MKSQKVSFQNKSGLSLSAKLELPEQDVKSYAIFAHCFTCTKNLSAIRNISHALNNFGIAVLRFDFTGLGESEGDFEKTNFSSNVDDLIAAADFLQQQYQAPKLIIGHSLGGAAVIFASEKLDSIQAIATIGAPSNPEHVAHLFDHKLSEIENRGVAKVNIGGRPFTIEKQFLDDLINKNTAQILSNSSKALVVFHSPQDRTVEIKNAAEIFKAAKHPKSFISLDGADHLLTDKADSIYTGIMIATWADRYIK